MKKLLLVANVAKEHVLKFHVPTIKALVDDGWTVDVACGGKEEVPYCHKQYELPIDRSPFKTHFIKAIKQLRRLIEVEEYGIVYCHTSVGTIVGRIAAAKYRKQGTRVVNFAHGTYFYKGAPITNWVLYPLYKVLSNVTDVNITITSEDYDFTKKYLGHGETYYVEGIGVDPHKFDVREPSVIRQQYRTDLNIPDDGMVLIYVGELIKNKNQILLMDILARILKTRNEFYLVLVGPDHTDGEYEKYAVKLGISEHVRFLGWRNDIGNLFAMSDICTASSIREGLGLNLIEAMICQRPVIATRNSGHQAVITDGYNGFLVNQGDVDGFVDRILQITNNSMLYKQLVDNASSEVDKYFTENILRKLLGILNSQICEH